MEMTTTQGEAQQEIRRSLFELYELAQTVEHLYEEASGEVDWRTEQWQTWLDQSSGQTVDALCSFRAEAIGVAEAAKSEIKRLQQVIERQANREAWAEDRLLDVLRKLGVSRLEHGTWHVHTRKGSARVEQDGDVDLAFLDPSLVREVPARLEPDRSKIAARLKKGEEIPPFRLAYGPETVVIK